MCIRDRLPGGQVSQPGIRWRSTGALTGMGDRRPPRRLRLGREKFGEGHYHCGGVANATINEALKPFYLFFRCFACRPAAFCAVWGGRPKGEPPLANFKLHVARVRVCVSLAALAGVRCGIGGQPVLMQAFSASVTQYGYFSGVLSGS